MLLLYSKRGPLIFCFYLYSSVLCVENGQNFSSLVVDYSPFRNYVKLVLQNTTDLPIVENCNIRQCCDIPNRAISFTYIHSNSFHLIQLQRRAMDVGLVRSCLEKRFITVCLDKKCKLLCESNNIPGCMRLKIPEIISAHFGTVAYRFMTWIKHELMYEALKVADEVFFFDADVLIFRNPWPEVRYGRDDNGKKIDGPYDIQYQRERGMRYKGCAGSVNTGQLYLRNSTRMSGYFKYLFDKKTVILTDPSRLDQDYVSDIIGERILTKYCTLPPHKVQGNCPFSQEPGNWDDLISFHATCANTHEKVQVLKSKLHEQESHLRQVRPVDQILKNAVMVGGGNNHPHRHSSHKNNHKQQQEVVGDTIKRN